MIGRLLCAFGWHRWGPMFFSGRILMRQCQRCRRTNYQDPDTGTWREEDGT